MLRRPNLLWLKPHCRHDWIAISIFVGIAARFLFDDPMAKPLDDGLVGEPMSRHAACFLIALSFAALAVPASAHPHVWVTYETTIVYEKGAVTGVEHTWTFDGGMTIRCD